ncbi:MAG: zf-HC2 domain-containing protein [Anaerolineae bacterium]|nr:zf-HC2 domain-containing protein [Anaerolineae bacterium]
MRRHITHYLAAYITGELPPHLARRVGQHVQVCDSCYAALQRERDLTSTLQTQFATFGVPRPAQLARVRPAVLMAMQAPPAPRRFWPGMGLVLALSLVVALLLPMLVAPRLVSAINVPDQHGPDVLAGTMSIPVTDTPAQVHVAPTAVAQRLEEAATALPDLVPPPAPVAQATPGR